MLLQAECDFMGVGDDALAFCFARRRRDLGEWFVAAGEFPAQQKAAQHAKGKNVPAVAGFIEVTIGLLQLFRSLVEEGVGVFQVGDARHLADGPVGQQQLAGLGKENIARFEVAVGDLAFVHPRQRPC